MKILWFIFFMLILNSSNSFNLKITENGHSDLIKDLKGFKCFEWTNIEIPVRLGIDGDIECLSINGKNCIDNLKTNKDCISFINNNIRNINTLSCGLKRNKIKNKLDLLNKPNWCSKAFDYFYNKWHCKLETGIKTPIRINFETLNIECLSKSGKDCIWGDTTNEACEKANTCIKFRNKIKISNIMNNNNTLSSDKYNKEKNDNNKNDLLDEDNEKTGGNYKVINLNKNKIQEIDIDIESSKSFIGNIKNDDYFTILPCGDIYNKIWGHTGYFSPTNHWCQQGLAFFRYTDSYFCKGLSNLNYPFKLNEKGIIDLLTENGKDYTQSKSDIECLSYVINKTENKRRDLEKIEKISCKKIIMNNINEDNSNLKLCKNALNVLFLKNYNKQKIEQFKRLEIYLSRLHQKEGIVNLEKINKKDLQELNINYENVPNVINKAFESTKNFEIFYKLLKKKLQFINKINIDNHLNEDNNYKLDFFKKLLQKFNIKKIPQIFERFTKKANYKNIILYLLYTIIKNDNDIKNLIDKNNQNSKERNYNNKTIKSCENQNTLQKSFFRWNSFKKQFKVSFKNKKIKIKPKNKAISLLRRSIIKRKPMRMMIKIERKNFKSKNDSADDFKQKKNRFNRENKSIKYLNKGMNNQVEKFYKKPKSNVNQNKIKYLINNEEKNSKNKRIIICKNKRVLKRMSDKKNSSPLNNVFLPIKVLRILFIKSLKRLIKAENKRNTESLNKLIDYLIINHIDDDLFLSNIRELYFKDKIPNLKIIRLIQSYIGKENINITTINGRRETYEIRTENLIKNDKYINYFTFNTNKPFNEFFNDIIFIK